METALPPKRGLYNMLMRGRFLLLSLQAIVKPIGCCALFGHPKCVELLLLAGADVDCVYSVLQGDNEKPVRLSLLQTILDRRSTGLSLTSYCNCPHQLLTDVVMRMTEAAASCRDIQGRDTLITACRYQ